LARDLATGGRGNSVAGVAGASTGADAPELVLDSGLGCAFAFGFAFDRVFGWLAGGASGAD